MKRSAVWLSLGLLACTTQVWAQDAGERADRRGDRIERRLDQRGDRAENRLDRRGDRVDTPPGPRFEVARNGAVTTWLPTASMRAATASTAASTGAVETIDRTLDRRGGQIDRRMDRRGESSRLIESIGRRRLREPAPSKLDSRPRKARGRQQGTLLQPGQRAATAAIVAWRRVHAHRDRELIVGRCSLGFDRAGIHRQLVEPLWRCRWPSRRASTLVCAVSVARRARERLPRAIVQARRRATPSRAEVRPTPSPIRPTEVAAKSPALSSTALIVVCELNARHRATCPTRRGRRRRDGDT